MRSRPGLLEHAHGGTLFLDEIADMPLTTQAKILRVLTDQSYHRVGGQRSVKVDVRVLSATSRNLPARSPPGVSARTCFYRLNVVPVRLPPLGSAGRIFRSSSAISSRGSPRNAACMRWTFRKKPWPRCKRTTGQAISVSYAILSSERSSSGHGVPAPERAQLLAAADRRDHDDVELPGPRERRVQHWLDRLRPPIHHAPLGQHFFTIGVQFAGTSSIMTALNFMVTIITMRAPGMTFWRMPLLVWANFTTSLLS